MFIVVAEAGIQIQKQNEMEALKERDRVEQKYSVVYADVPWEDEHWFLGRLRELPVINHIGNDALLLLWVQSSRLTHGLLVLGEWCFNYAGLLTWRKSPERVDRVFTNSVCEYMLVGYMGSVQTSHVMWNM